MRETSHFADNPGMVGAPFLAWTTLKVAEVCGKNIAQRFVGPLEQNWNWWRNSGTRHFSNGACSGLWHWDNVYEAIRDSNRNAGHPNLPSWFLGDGKLIIQEICPPDLNFFLLSNLRAIVGLKKMLGAASDNLQSEADALAGRIRQVLWDEGRQFFFGRRNNGDLIAVKDIGGWMALFASGANTDQAQKMVSRYLNCQSPKPDDFCTNVGIPSLAKGEPGYGSNEHWLGGVWPAYTLMSIVGLKNYNFSKEAARIATSFSNAVNNGLKNNIPLPEWYDNEVGIRREALFCIDQVQNKEQQKWVNCNYITSALALPAARFAGVDADSGIADTVKPGGSCQSGHYTTCMKKPWGANKTLVCSAEQKIIACGQCVDGKVHDPKVAVDAHGYYHDFATECE